MGRLVLYGRYILARIKKSDFIKNVSVIVSGVAIGQVISLVGTPINSRIYGAEAYGELGIITSTAAIFSNFMTLGLTSAIMAPPDDHEANGISKIVVSSVAIFSTVILIAALLFSPVLKIFKVENSYYLALLFFYIFMLLNNMQGVFYVNINRKKLYRVLFWNPVIGSCANFAVTISLGLLGYIRYGLIVGSIISVFIVIIHMLKYVNPFRGRHSIKELWELIKKNNPFIIYQMPSNQISIIAEQLPVQLLSRFFGNTVLGYYTMCNRFLNIPVKFVAAPISTVYFKRATDDYSEGRDLGSFTFELIRKTISFAIIPVTVLMVFGEQIFSVLLGQEWAEAGKYASVLGINTLMVCINQCLSYDFVIIRKQSINLIYSLCSLAINTLFMYGAFYIFREPVFVLIAYAVANTILIIVFKGIYLKYIKVNLWKYSKFIFLYIIIPTILAVLINSVLN